MSSVYYNDNDPYCAQWLRNLIAKGLIPAGEVDERDIRELGPDDLRGYRQVHFFAGIGGWAKALRIAGWSDERPVWTGSCPCQPFSAAGKRKGVEDERHLWPEMLRLIRECKPETVFGEQVASSEVVGTELETAFLVAVQAGEFARANKFAKRLVKQSSFHFFARWLDGISADLEEAGYAIWSSVLGAHSVGAPHIRQRLFWVADSQKQRCGQGRSLASWRNERGDADAWPGFVHGSAIGGLANLLGQRLEERQEQPAREELPSTERGGDAGGLEHTEGEQVGISGCARQQRGALIWMGNPESDNKWWYRQFIESKASAAGRSGPWSDFDIVHCADGKARRIESGTFPLAHGVPGRVGRLRAYGNAIVPQVAAEFIRTAM